MDERLLALAIRLLPRRRRELGRALLAELAALPPGHRRSAWLIGGLWFVGKESAMRILPYGLGLGAATAVLLTIDRIGTSDDSGQVTLLVLLTGTAALGFAAPRFAWLSGLAMGSAIAVSALVAPTTATHPGNAATLFVLVLPALAGAYLGAGANWLLRRKAVDSSR
jgi:hypothetical protein